MVGDDAYEHLLEQLRTVIDRARGTDAGSQALTAATRLLEETAARLGPPGSLYGPDGAPGRAVRSSPLLAPLVCTIEGGRLTGTLTFTPAFEGAGSVHGGHVAATFDTVLGRLANSVARCHTASLTVDYRRPTPCGVNLDVEATASDVDGRKLRLAGTLRSGSTLYAEATGLFVTVAEW